MNSAYIASIVNSTLRSTTPILLAALGSAVCSRVGVFNIALEAQMLIACFFSIAVNYTTGSVLLSVAAGIFSGALVGLIVAVLQVKYRAADMVIGTSLNLLVQGGTTFLLYLFFGLRGVLNDPKLVSLNKINLPVIRDIPFLGRALENLTILDYLCYVIQSDQNSNADGGALRCPLRFGRNSAEHGTGDYVYGEHDVRPGLYCHGCRQPWHVSPAVDGLVQPVLWPLPGHRGGSAKRYQESADHDAALYCHHCGPGDIQPPGRRSQSKKADRRALRRFRQIYNCIPCIPIEIYNL